MLKIEQIPTFALTDNKSPYKVLNSLAAMSNLLFQVEIALIRQMIKREQINLKWVERNKQLGNCLTKKGASLARLINILKSGHFQN